jgi:hypothetical protein
MPQQDSYFSTLTPGQVAKQRQQTSPEGGQFGPIEPANLDPYPPLRSQPANASILQYLQMIRERLVARVHKPFAILFGGVALATGICQVIVIRDALGRQVL